MTRQFLTRSEAAEYLGMSVKWLAQSGRFSGPPYYKFGTACQYRLVDLEDWVRQQRVRD